jgi:hypothetical protein
VVASVSRPRIRVRQVPVPSTEQRHRPAVGAVDVTSKGRQLATRRRTRARLLRRAPGSAWVGAAAAAARTRAHGGRLYCLRCFASSSFFESKERLAKLATAAFCFLWVQLSWGSGRHRGCAGAHQGP